MEPNTVHILGISGSLRKNSINTGLLRSIEELLPQEATFSIHPLHDIPMYNGDLEPSIPQAVSDFKEAIAKADGLIIATPEYNYSIPGVLKNAIDWASRPAYRSVLARKPVGMMGASPGGLGTARAQDHLRHVLGAVLAYPFPHPGLLVSAAGQKFDAEQKLTDEHTREKMKTYLSEFSQWVQKLRKVHQD